MKLVATLSSPLVVYLPRKTMKDKSWILNLNVYRNTNRFTLNDVKVLYKGLMQEQLAKLPEMEKVAVRFILFPRTCHETDTPNVCCIHDKFFMDALVSAKKLPDDTFKYYVETSYKFGQVDKANPRVDIEIYQVK
jgi:hypothetical protein